jgi:PAS domain-containing protein
MKQWELTGVTVDVSDRSRVPGAPPVTPRPADTFRVLVDQCPALIWTTDSSLVFTSSLGGGLAALGIGPNQLVGVSLLELVNEDAPDPKPLAAHERALRGETVTFEMKWGDLVFQARVAPLVDARGIGIGTVCVALDDTEASKKDRVGGILGLLAPA